MKNVEVLYFANSDELARAAAAEWLSALKQAPPQAPFLVALAGGRISRNFYGAVRNLFGPGETPSAGAGQPLRLLKTTHFFWGDERCVPPTDAESNFALADTLLLKPLAIPSSQIHRIRGETLPEAAAAEAAEALSQVARLTPQGQPIFDIIFLGMGEDGHAASLFPGESEAAVASPKVYRAVVASKPPPGRITLGYQAIAAAREVWVLASGAGKEAALRQSLSEEGTTPLARVIRMRPSTKIFTDITS